MDEVYNPEPKTLAELVTKDSIGTLFEVIETKENFQIAGVYDGLVLARSFGSTTLIPMPLDTRIHRIF